MFRLIAWLQNKPASVRSRAAFVVALAGTLIVAFMWVSSFHFNVENEKFTAESAVVNDALTPLSLLKEQVLGIFETAGGVDF